MGTALLLLALLLAAYAIIPNSYPAYPRSATATLARSNYPSTSKLPWLHSNGKEILDSAGDQVLLRGMNVTGLLQAKDMRPGPVPTPMDFAEMAADGFDVIRIPISWSLLEPRPGRFSASYLGLLKRVVGEAAKEGIYSVLDFHNIDWSMYYGGDGAPSWLTAGFLPRSFPAGSPWNRHLAPGVLASYGIFWADLGGWQQDAIQAWTVVARAFSHDSAVAAFDLWNEPHPFPIPPGLFEAKFLLPFEARLISTMARVAPRQMYMGEQTLDFGLPTYVGRLPYPNQIFSSHVFATLLEPPWQAPVPQYGAPLSLLESQARTAGAAPWVGEVGGPPGAVGNAWIAREMNQLDSYRLGWAYWDWNEGGSWAFVKHPSRLRLVARAYPRTTPGQLTSLSYAPSTGELAVGINGPTEGRPLVIEVPRFLTHLTLSSSIAGPPPAYRLDPSTHLLTIDLPAVTGSFTVRVHFS